jgi:hypothetical protein
MAVSVSQESNCSRLGCLESGRLDVVYPRRADRSGSEAICGRVSNRARVATWLIGNVDGLDSLGLFHRNVRLGSYVASGALREGVRGTGDDGCAHDGAPHAGMLG